MGKVKVIIPVQKGERITEIVQVKGHTYYNVVTRTGGTRTVKA